MPCFYSGAFTIASIIGVILGALAWAISFLVSLFLFRRGGKPEDKAFRYSLIIASLLAVPVCWISTNSFFKQAVGGPPSPRWRPDNNDIIGVWQLSEHSLRGIQEEGYPPSSPKLEFMGDGTFHLTDIPEIVADHLTIVDSQKNEHNFCSGHGTWTVLSDPYSEWAIEVEIVEFKGCRAEGGVMTYLHLYGERPPYDIYVWRDVDAGSMWVFKRQKGE
jgi:hypothetical protein